MRSRIVKKYKDVDVVCGHCKNKTKTLNAVTVGKDRLVIACNKCTEKLLNKE